MNNIKLYRTALLLCCLVYQASLLAAESALDDFFAETVSLQADFEQRIIDDTGSVIEISSGRFYLSRPGKFRWDYQDASGALGQQIVADGQSIYIYDPDLEQVNVRSFDNALTQVPSLLLVHSGDDLASHFVIEDLSVIDDLHWVSLKPKSEDASYQQLMVGLDDKQLTSIVLFDALGNETRLRFKQVLKNSQLAPRLFKFEVPEGADVLGQ